ncbi:MAG TPA: thiamine pyrophosphate-dependent enzyme [Deltaproteobacteria bacterium]|nr:thiamine pyrophosphate-dependent enzyme [Deltaproteobacteria bacterium]HPP81623.1 thiamine pyrophosphate-dependent enzyme [Deltaproteobacteria bacterium]
MQPKTTILSLPEEEFVNPGTRACAGCGLGIAYRVALKAVGRDAILIVPPSCLTVLQGLYPVAATRLPCLNVTFASTAAAATGMVAALKALGRKDTRVVAWAGDGGTADIGLQALSGAAERGDDFLFICYDNEGYMNTGVQRSGTTPMGAVTANTLKGKLQQKKDVPAIMAAHNLSYVATCSAAFPLDLYEKVVKALGMSGVKYLHIQIPCPPGWGYDPKYTVKIGKLAVETGMFTLYEAEHGVVRLTGASRKLADKRSLVPVSEYFRAQSRFSLVDEEAIRQIQSEIEGRWQAVFDRAGDGEEA